LAAHANCWSDKSNSAGWRGEDKNQASVCGRRAGQVERRRRGAPSGTKPERNARRRATDGRPPLLRPCTMQARDERAICEAEWAASRGGQGRRTAREARQTARWSRRKTKLPLCSVSHENSSKRIKALIPALPFII
jgi:hypothetical protein